MLVWGVLYAYLHTRIKHVTTVVLSEEPRDDEDRVLKFRGKEHYVVRVIYIRMC